MLPATGPRLEYLVEAFAEAKGALVEGEAASGAVVAIEIALAVA